MQPTSMVTMLEARENVLSEVTRPGMESNPSLGRPAVSFLCPAISYSRYRLFPTPTGLLKRPHPSQDLQQPDAIVLYSSTWLTVIPAQAGIHCGAGDSPAQPEAVYRIT
jgi:hypothetical protein